MVLMSPQVMLKWDMVFVRSVSNQAMALAKAATISIRYGSIRKQGEPVPE